MPEKEEAKSEKKDNEKLEIDLNFAPSWARKDPTANLQRYRDAAYDLDDGDYRQKGWGGRDSSNERRPRHDFDRNRRYPARDRPQYTPSRRDTGHRHSDLSGFKSGGARAGLKETFDSVPQQDHFRRAGGPPAYRAEDRQERFNHSQLPVEIRVLPEQKALGAVIRRIQSSHRAFPLREIARLFLDNPGSCFLRIEPSKERPTPLFQCKICGMPALTEDEVRRHLMVCHMEDFFDVEEVDCDPPSGTFVCVAKCGLSGELLAPPNHHSFNQKVHEMMRTRYPDMSEEDYRAHIETVRDPEVIEQWRMQCTKKKMYRRKGIFPMPDEPVSSPDGKTPAEAAADAAPKAPLMEREIAETIFLREIVPTEILSAKHLICTAAVAMRTQSNPLFFAVKQALANEHHFPASLFFALRGAFRHRNLYLFHVNDPHGPDFVVLRQPVKLRSSNTVQVLRDVLTFVTEHPGCNKSDLLAALSDGDKAKTNEILNQLAWLVEKGHIIHFYNDVLSPPMEYPVFHYSPPGKTPARKNGHEQGEKAARQNGHELPPDAQPDPAAVAEVGAGKSAETPSPVSEEGTDRAGPVGLP